MMHITEEEMIEQVYGEGGKAGAVERHLEACRACAEAFAELKRDLAEVDRVQAPARDAHYGDRVWAAIADTLPVYSVREKRRWWSPGGRAGFWLTALSYAAGCALLVSSAFYAGRMWEQRQRPHVAAVQQAPAAPQPKQPIVVVVLDDHLDRSERFLVQLKHADLDNSALVSPMRDEARSLLAANRVCRKNTAQDSDPELKTALDHLDRLLAEAVNAPGGLNATSIVKLQDEMNADGLLLEVRVLRARISNREAAGKKPAKGGTI
jgi:hypothetical protein